MSCNTFIVQCSPYIHPMQRFPRRKIVFNAHSPKMKRKKTKRWRWGKNVLCTTKVAKSKRSTVGLMIKHGAIGWWGCLLSWWGVGGDGKWGCVLLVYRAAAGKRREMLLSFLMLHQLVNSRASALTVFSFSLSITHRHKQTFELLLLLHRLRCFSFDWHSNTHWRPVKLTQIWKR